MVAAGAKVLTRRVLVGYAAGQFGAQICRDVPSSLLLFFMTQVLGVRPVLAGAAILLPKLWVVAGDLLVGVISDRTVSRWGRRRPYLLAGAIVASAGFVAIFWSPTGRSAEFTATYVACAYLVLCTGLSLFAVPHLAMASEISDDAAERTRALSVRQVFLLAAVLAGLVGAPNLIGAAGGGVAGYRLMGLVLGGAMLVTMLAPVITVRTLSHAATGAPRRVLSDLRGAWTNRGFRALISANFMQALAAGTSSTAAVYFITDALGFDLQTFGRYALSSIVGAALSQPIWVFLARRLGRSSTYPLSIGLHIFALMLSLLLPPLLLPALFLVGLVTGTANAGFSLMSASMLTDVIQADARATGGRAALLSSVYTMTEKLALALGAFLVAAILGASGYVESRGVQVTQTTDAIDATRYTYAVLTMGLQAVTLLLTLHLRRTLAAESTVEVLTLRAREGSAG